VLQPNHKYLTNSSVGWAFGFDSGQYCSIFGCTSMGLVVATFGGAKLGGGSSRVCAKMLAYSVSVAALCGSYKRWTMILHRLCLCPEFFLICNLECPGRGLVGTVFSVGLSILHSIPLILINIPLTLPHGCRIVCC
jgi:hypothetical protein